MKPSPINSILKYIQKKYKELYKNFAHTFQLQNSIPLLDILEISLKTALLKIVSHTDQEQYIIGLPSSFSISIPKKLKRKPPIRNSLYFQEWNCLAQRFKKYLFSQKKPSETDLSSSNIKRNSPYFLKRKHFLFLRKGNPALFSPSLRNKKTPSREILLYFSKQKLPKNPCILRNKNS